MSRFYVGQRVRIRADSPGLIPKFAGAEGVFVSYGTEGLVPEFFDDCTVRALGETRTCRSWALEPILPSGHRSGDYSYTELMDRLKAGEVECV